MARIVIDPVTRIEGHLKIEVEVTDNTVVSAWSSGTLYRGIETILQGRLAEDAWLFTQRLCGVCTYVHGVSSVRCVEDAIGESVPANARVVRNLLMGGQYVHDHLVHFYHLNALDWVDIVSALSADASATQALAATLSPSAPAIDFAAVKARLAGLAASGQLGPFSGGWWGHPSYHLTPEENLLFAAHYLSALRQQIQAAKMHAIFGAKNPHIQSLRVGGVTCEKEITTTRITEFRTLLSAMRAFIDTVYLPDVRYLAGRYASWKAYGGCSNYLCYGDFPQTALEPQSNLFARGRIAGRDIANLLTVDTGAISEHVARSWYSGAASHPSSGSTVPAPGAYNTDARYSWLKAPRYDGSPMEVGPLARMLVTYAAGGAAAVAALDGFLAATGLTIGDMHSTLGRIAARALETKIVADAMDSWLSALTPGQYALEQVDTMVSGSGMGLNEAPRGALGHWISMNAGKITNYQMVVPSTWNLGPRCAAGIPGPVEQALVGTPVADPSKPLEILRTVHSFDPCIACAVHVLDTRHDRRYTVRAV